MTVCSDVVFVILRFKPVASQKSPDGPVSPLLMRVVRCSPCFRRTAPAAFFIQLFGTPSKQSYVYRHGLGWCVEIRDEERGEGQGEGQGEGREGPSVKTSAIKPRSDSSFPAINAICIS